MDRVDYHPLVIQDLLNMHKAEELDLNPWYQRRSTWTPPQQAYLINTLFEQKPVPTMYIRHSIDMEKEKSIKEVVDGQQRMRAILDYTADKFASRHPAHDDPVKYSQLTATQKQEFRMTTLSIGALIGAEDADVIDIFGRLNSVAKTLNVQEKRNAKFSGEFKQFCLRQAAKRVKLWRQLRIFTANDIARMVEVQFVSELVINLMQGLVDYSVKRIDAVYGKYDVKFSQRRELAKRIERVFAKIASLNPTVIRDTIFSRSPLFFSLFLILDEQRAKIPNTRLEEGLYEIDQRFNSSKPVVDRPKADAEFFVACQSNPHRIKSRRIRQRYIKSHLV